MSFGFDQAVGGGVWVPLRVDVGYILTCSNVRSIRYTGLSRVSGTRAHIPSQSPRGFQQKKLKIYLSLRETNRHEPEAH